MGGFWSGRHSLWNTKPVVEDALLVLDVNAAAHSILPAG
jgi:hypothetical protein